MIESENNKLNDAELDAIVGGNQLVNGEDSTGFSHTRPNGKAWYTVNSKIQGGENLAYGFDNSSEGLDAWMKSL